ncbi:MAG: hypothetical protein K5695_17215 [Oscillospiraceae bacterium]|nr:hypothetical protein [Oscillospiraceae bacterium]
MWSVHLGNSKGTPIGLIETVFRVGSKAIVFGSDMKMKKSGISMLYCRYFHKNTLMSPDQDGRLRIPMYPECPTLVEKVTKHLHAGK